MRRCRWKCESRRKMDSSEQCAVAREFVADPDAWMSASWGNGGLKHMIVTLHPEEAFAGEAAVPVFRAHIEDGVI